MVRFMRVWLLFGILLSTLTAQNVRIGIYQNAPKYFMDETGQASGFFGELIGHIAQTGGWTVEYVPCNWKECLEKTERGDIDLMPDVAYTPRRALRFDFNREIVLSNWVVLYVNKHTRVNSVTDLDGKRIALLKGSIQEELITRTSKEFGVTPTLIYVKSLMRALEETQAGNADVCAVNELFGREHASRFVLYKSPLAFSPDRLHIVSKKGANRALLDAIDEELKKLKADKHSLYYRLSDRWFAYAGGPSGKLLLTPEEKAWLKTHSLIRAGVHVGHAPIEYIDSHGKVTGISVRLLEHIASLLDVKVRFVPVETFDALERIISEKTVDLVANTGGIERFSRLKQVPLDHSVPIAIFAEESAPRRADVLELRGRKIAVVEECMFKEQLKRTYPYLDIITLNDYDEVVKQVRSGKIDAFAGNQAVVAHFLHQRGYADIKIALPTSLNCKPAFGVRPDWPRLAVILDKALKSIPDEQKAAIRRHFIGIPYDTSVDYSLIGKISGGLMLLLLGMFFWNRRLKREICERQRTEKELQDALETLKETQSRLMRQDKLDSLSDLITNIAHHWRQPLNMLALYIGDLKDAKVFNELDDAYLDRFYTKSQKTIREMSQMIDRFRQFYVEEEERSRFSLKDAINRALSMVDARLENSGIRVEYDIRTDAFVDGYPNAFSQVLLSLLHNARESLSEKIRGEKLITITLEVRSDGIARVMVADNGGGIPEENLEKVFEPYFTTKFQSKGVGASLYMAKMVIEKRMGGTISAGNAENGARFIIETATVPTPPGTV